MDQLGSLGEWLLSARDNVPHLAQNVITNKNHNIKSIASCIWATSAVWPCMTGPPLASHLHGDPPSEVPYYGRSPPVYPSREFIIS